MNDDLFSGVLQWDFPVPALGRTAKLPVFYRDAASMTATFLASTRHVRRLLPLGAMHPVEMVPGRCLVGFSAFEYRCCDIDPYNELSISVPITFGRRSVPGATLLAQMARRRFSAYIWQLPVTTEIARWGGVQMYGYPKFIADISFRRAGGMRVCSLAHDGVSILELRGRELDASPQPLLRFETYSVKDGIPLRANVVTRPIRMAQSFARSAAELQIGAGHEIGRTLRELELGSRPVFYQYCPESQMILFAPRNLLDA
jgi:hypothetical protein